MVGRKSADALRREFGDLYQINMKVWGTSVTYSDAAKIADRIRLGLRQANLTYAP